MENKKVDAKICWMTISNLCKFWNAVTQTFDTKNILKEVMIWQNTGNVLEERFSNEGWTLERRKNIGNPTPI